MEPYAINYEYQLLTIMNNLLRATVILSVLALSACSAEKLTFQGTFGPHLQSARHTDIARAVSRVMERRAESVESKATDMQNTLTGTSGLVITFTLKPGKGAALLAREVVEPFTFRFMRAAKAGETADLTTAQDGGFIDMGITKDDLLWLTAGEDERTKKGWIEIIFTEAGKKKVKTALTQTKGLQVALVVRNQLVSTFQSTGVGQENIYIDGVPSAELAGIFVDDVNVGAHVTFTAQ